MKRPSLISVKMNLFDALQDAIDSPCEPIAWKRSRLEDSEIAHNSLIDENFDFLSFEVPGTVSCMDPARNLDEF